MKARPAGVDEDVVIRALSDGWDVEVERLEYAPVGFGSYHWVATAADRRVFITVDDLDHVPWLGETRASSFDALLRAFDSAHALRAGGLAFVVAPIASRSGETARSLGPRHSLALFPFVDGKSGTYGAYASAGERDAVIGLLAELHGATSLVDGVARRASLDLPGRALLEAGLRELDHAWTGGRYSEPARAALSAHASGVAAALASRDRLADAAAGTATEPVVTHGEPHPGNVMRAAGDLVLVDWDTLALAPPERDLWHMGGGHELYAELTGRRVDPDRLLLYRTSWDLADLAVFVQRLRSPHADDADTEASFGHLVALARSVSGAGLD